MVANIHKKAIFLDNQPFTVTAYLRAVTDDLVARFGSAEQGQTNLDLLKAETQKSFRGGMFQRTFEDPEKVSVITNAIYNRLDDNLYPTPEWQQTIGAADMDAQGVTSYCYFQGFLYIVFKNANPPNIGKNVVVKHDLTAGTSTAISLPSGMAGHLGELRLTAYKTFIAVATMSYGGSTTGTWKYDGNTTFTAVGGDLQEFFVFNSNLYGVQCHGTVFKVNDPSLGTWAYTLLGQAGTDAAAGQTEFNSVKVYNGAAYIGMKHGLYRFDGTTVSCVLDYSRSADPDNFTFMEVFNGRLYYNIKNKLFQFDGANVEMLQDFGAGYRIRHLAGSADRLWIGIISDTSVVSTDKYNPGAPVYQHSVFCYDGVGFFEYRAFTPILQISYTQLTLVPVNGKVYLWIPDVYLNASLEPRSNGNFQLVLDLANEFTINNVGDGFQIISSEVDNDYPSVAKVINGVMTNYGGLTSGEGYFKLELQELYRGEWSEWHEVWNTQNVVNTGASNDYLLHEQSLYASPELITEPLPYHRLRWRLTLAITDSTPTTLPYVSDFSARYTVQPRLRMKWLLTLDLTGVDTRGLYTPTGSDDVDEDRSAAALRRVIYDAYRNKKPILFYDADFTTIKDTEDGLQLHGTDFISSGDIIAIQQQSDLAGKWANIRINDVVYDEVDQETSGTLIQFGLRIGIGGAEVMGLGEGLQVRKSHAVYIKNIRNERYILDDNTINDDAGDLGFSDIPSEITLDLVEV